MATAELQAETLFKEACNRFDETQELVPVGFDCEWNVSYERDRERGQIKLVQVAIGSKGVLDV
jgi:hypothetical protein